MDSDALRQPDQLRQQQAIFLRTVAHALRTPLQSLQGFAELLEPGLSPAQVDHYIGFIKRDTAYITAIVDDLCLRYELERGPVHLFPAVVEVGSLLTELAQAFEATVPDCLVMLDYSDDAPALFADRDRLLHALWTLLRNAERCRPDPSHPGCAVVLARLVAPSRRIEFVVEDDGLVIPPECAAALFEPLAELPTVLGRPRLGVGLGLFVAREVARQMGGDLWLEYTHAIAGRQRGNTFILSVPVFEGEVGHA
ncbi:MAG TPA: HAMP domain-containing sensor histidine kinase [Aggregatilineales bacterium]|nr:HAMP domain-containing sensor histidine kinase [Aggregatilineales bacterium]